jgi:hypothetical protein
MCKAQTETILFAGNDTMSNPWLKKNPFMSMWLSGAQQATTDLIRFWSGAAWTGAAAAPVKRRRRRR